jgi:antitoxin CptB
MEIPSRLRWRCRRGTQELDLILLRFLEREYATLSSDDLMAFERLLECEDDRLQAWLLGGAMAEDPSVSGIVQRIRAGYP